ncbi:MAG: hypothetical protein ACLR4Z_17040 [Butyricicoccaceae bacterium]
MTACSRRYQHFEHLLALAQILASRHHIGLCSLGTSALRTLSSALLCKS